MNLPPACSQLTLCKDQRDKAKNEHFFIPFPELCGFQESTYNPLGAFLNYKVIPHLYFILNDPALDLLNFLLKKKLCANLFKFSADFFGDLYVMSRWKKLNQIQVCSYLLSKRLEIQKACLIFPFFAFLELSLTFPSVLSSHLLRSPPRPSPGSLHYSDEDVSTKYNDLIPAESSSLTEKPSEISDSQVSTESGSEPIPNPLSGIGNEPTE